MVDKKRKSKKGKSKKGLKQKQKQKQQVVVNVSSGGGGGGGFIPAPQAPTFDYSLLANLIRPAATVDVPIAAQQMAAAMPSRAAEAPSLASSIGTQTDPLRNSMGIQTDPLRNSMGTQTGPTRSAPATPIRKPVKRVSVEDMEREFNSSMATESGAVIGGGIFNRPARDKAAGRIPSEPLEYQGGGGIFGGGGRERRATKKSAETEELYNPDVPSVFI